MIQGARSYRNLATCDPRLQVLLIAAAEEWDFVVTCGHRNEADQNKAVAEGRSRVRFPDGKHNSLPSKAVDVAPWPVNWLDLGRFDRLGYHVLEVANRLGIAVTWGGTWTTLVDRPHFELKDS